MKTRNLFCLTILLMTTLSCNLAGVVKKAADKTREPKPLLSADGKILLTIPGGWKEDKALHESAELEASNRIQEMYVIVLRERKEDFDEDTTLSDYALLTRKGFEQNIAGAQLTGVIPAQIGQQSAMEYQLEGSVDKIKVKYLCTVVETPGHFYQILAWSLRSRFDQNEETLRKVTESFKELNVSASSPEPT